MFFVAKIFIAATHFSKVAVLEKPKWPQESAITFLLLDIFLLMIFY